MIEITLPQNLVPPSLLAKLGRRQLDQLAKNLADAARAKWLKFAQEDRSSMRGDYIRGIQKPVISAGTAAITLVGSVANMLEHGAPETDLRDLLLGDQVKLVPRGQRGKHEALEGGYYRPVPFRHATPGAAGQVVGQEMGSAYSGHEAVADSKKLGREVYGAALGLGASRSQPGLGAKYGGRLVTWRPGERPPGGTGVEVPKLKDHHKTDIYSGMIREQKVYEQAEQSQYITFRTISTHVTEIDEFTGEHTRMLATEGWVRGPIRARKYAQKVADFVAKIAPKAVEAMVEGGRR